MKQAGLLLIVCLGMIGARGQEQPPPAADSSAGGEPGLAAALVTMLGPVLLPKFVADATVLKEMVRSDEFREYRRRRGDIAAVDTLFDRAKELSWGNLYAALLISTAAVVDHRRVGFDLPLLGALLWFPLTAEFEEDHAARVAALPSKLYADTPPSGDRDKLQHFFGSALVALLSESREAAERTGEFVEWGESAFIVGGVNDPRDHRANLEGRLFGLRLLIEPSARPSRFLGRSGPLEE